MKLVKFASLRERRWFGAAILLAVCWITLSLLFFVIFTTGDASKAAPNFKLLTWGNYYVVLIALHIVPYYAVMAFATNCVVNGRKPAEQDGLSLTLNQTLMVVGIPASIVGVGSLFLVPRLAIAFIDTHYLLSLGTSLVVATFLLMLLRMLRGRIGPSAKTARFILWSIVHVLNFPAVFCLFAIGCANASRIAHFLHQSGVSLPL